MEQILAESNKSMYKASRILELNPHHEVFATLKKLHETDPAAEAFKDYCSLLYDQALLIEGLPLEDPISFANKISSLMAKS
jgi:molecular chaperone HtpG